MAKVSVIVPVHNTRKYLRECVSSLQTQTLADIEIILVENLSSDGSLELCKQLATEDGRIKYISLDVADRSYARNAGIKIASSEYVGFVDSDDQVAPQMYEKLYEAAIKNHADLAGCNFVKVYPGVRKPKYQFSENGIENVLTNKQAVEMNFREEIPSSACVIIVKKGIALKHKFPEFKLFEDKATTYLFCAAADRCVWINKSFYIYHQYRGGVVKYSKNFRESHDSALADIDRLLFIRNSNWWTEDQKAQVASRTANSFLRMLNRMNKAASSADEKSELKRLSKEYNLIPRGCALSLKARIILTLLKLFS